MKVQMMKILKSKIRRKTKEARRERIKDIENWS